MINQTTVSRYFSSLNRYKKKLNALQPDLKYLFDRFLPKSLISLTLSLKDVTVS